MSLPVDRPNGDRLERRLLVPIITFLVATNVVASQPPERRPTATPTARANFESQKMLVKIFFDQMKFGLKKVMGPKKF